ncbi:MAG: sugar ABC transporter permease [Lachnospiraceae bacterium]|nr:sugar ABC transporter permease [Lachnospiraceae bacterium]
MKKSIIKRIKSKKRFFPLYLMLLPGMVYLFINNYIPMGGIIIAFKQYNYRKGIFGSAWNGLKNFVFLFKTNDAWIITRNTLCYNLVFIILGTTAAIAVSILLSEIRKERAKKTYQVVILLPYLISIVVVSYIVYGFLSSEYGCMNHLLPWLGGDKVMWYSTPTYWPVILVIVNLWKNIGYNTVLYYATLIGIDPSYYEAAVVDGATRWQRIRYITIPSLIPTISILTLMAISKIFYSDFGLFYQVPMNSGPLIDVTNTIDTYVYRGLMETSNIGMSAAAGVYQSVVGFVLVVAANWIVGRFDKESTLF